jgi:hypothetical protein
MEERERLGKRIGLIRVSPELPFYTGSEIPVESRRHRAVSRPPGLKPVAPGSVPGCPVRQPVHNGPVPESCSGQDSGAAPVRAPGGPVHRPAAPEISRKTNQVPPR